MYDISSILKDCYKFPINFSKFKMPRNITVPHKLLSQS